jgi:anti-sigma factor RsiW
MAALSDGIEDALLVAYLDGELEPERHDEVERMLRTDASLRARLAALGEGARPIRSTFGALLEAAPRKRLEAGFAAAAAKSGQGRPHRYRRMLVATSAALLLLVGGGLAGYFIAKPPANLFEEADTDEDAWVAAVLGQLSLYDAASVAAIEVNEAERTAQITRLGQELNLNLSESKVTLEGLTLKRADLLHFQGRKLAQLLYASGRHGPIALCIVQAPGGEGEGEVESREGFNFIYWAAKGRRFLLIGAAPAERISALADTVAARFDI